jgi:RimJ/RimL family protein N-acetyltransferase
VVPEEGKATFKIDRPLEIGLHLLIRHRHRCHGYGSEAARAFIDYVTTVLSARRIVSESSASEPQALRLMKRLGMAIEPSPKPDRPDRIIGLLQSPVAVRQTGGALP